ncbi:unnamed protein product [Cunninghamella blakesleeana]
MNSQKCKSCGSSKQVYDAETELKVCYDCGLVIEEIQYLEGADLEEIDNGGNKDSTTSIKPGLLSKRKKDRTKYKETLSTMQERFNTSGEEYKYINDLLQIYLKDERKIYEYSFTEVGLCLFYLVQLYVKRDSLMHYCQLLSLDYRKCLQIYHHMKMIFGSKVYIDPSDSLFNLLDKLIISCYPKLIQHDDWYSELKKTTKKTLKGNNKMDVNMNWTLDDQIIIKKNTVTMMELLRRHGHFDGKIAGPTIIICLAMNILHYKYQYQLKQQSSLSIPPSSFSSIKGFSFHHLNKYSQYNTITLKNRCKEILSQLVYFGKSLPWVKPNLKRDIDIIYYLDDILISIEKLEHLSSSSSLPEQHQPSDNKLTSKRNYQIEDENENENDTNNKQLYPSSNQKDIYSKLPSLSILDPIAFQKSEQLRKKRKLQIEQINHYHNKNDQCDNNNNNNNNSDNNSDISNDQILKSIKQLVESNQWDQASIIAMSDKEIISQSLRLSSQYPPHFPHALDQELFDGDLSKEESDIYIIP